MEIAVSSKEENGMVLAIKKAYAMNEADRIRMVNKGKRKINQEYDIKVLTKKLIDWINNN